MGRSTPSWIKRGAYPLKEAVLHAMVLHMTVLPAILRQFAGSARRREILPRQRIVQRSMQKMHSFAYV
jgi:hypothetical protein